MAYINSVVMLGNLCTDVELRYAKNSGEPVASFRIAVGSAEKVCFIPVVVFGKQAENAARFLQKGSACSLEGAIQMQTWKDKDTGKNRTSYSITAHRIQFIGGRSAEDQPAAQEQPPVTNATPAHRYSRADIPDSMKNNPPAPPQPPDPHVEDYKPDDDIPF